MWVQYRGVRYPIWFNSMFEFCQKIIHSIFDSILLYPRFNSKYYSIQKKSADSIQKIIQFNSQGTIDTGPIGKVPKNCPKSVQNRQKGEFSGRVLVLAPAQSWSHRPSHRRTKPPGRRRTTLCAISAQCSRDSRRASTDLLFLNLWHAAIKCFRR